MSAYFNSTITRDEECKDLVDVNPDVTGLGVVITLLVHSILVVGITLCISFLHFFDCKEPLCHENHKKLHHEYRKNLRHSLVKGLYKVCGVLYGTFFAQLIASLVIFDSLSFDQRFLIAATQVIATVQITTSGFFFKTYELLHNAHTTLCLIQSGLSFAYGIMAMRPDKNPLEKQCLVSYWPSELSSSALRPDILAMLGACWWAIVWAYMCVQGWQRWKEQFKTFINTLTNRTTRPSKAAAHSDGTSDGISENRVAPIVLAYCTACCWIVMVYFTITTYLTAGHLKKSSADQELRSFGQILALCTIGGSLWQLIVCIIRTPRAPSAEPQASSAPEKGANTTASEVNENT
ncbi:hypothetical protein BDD12DRAFT_877067 [Trichophaea hybrida]|nr:hypothetical protein BDD12DRAFT_877067 [Trichophaea hybrida]